MAGRPIPPPRREGQWLGALKRVPLGYEIWRQFNGFPPVVADDAPKKSERQGQQGEATQTLIHNGFWAALGPRLGNPWTSHVRLGSELAVSWVVKFAAFTTVLQNDAAQVLRTSLENNDETRESEPVDQGHTSCLRIRRHSMRLAPTRQGPGRRRLRRNPNGDQRDTPSNRLTRQPQRLILRSPWINSKYSSSL